MLEQIPEQEVCQRILHQALMNWSEVEFRRLLEKLPAGAYMCDPNGLITYFNQRAIELWGRAPKLNDPEDRFCGSFKLFSSDGSPIRPEQCWMALALHNNAEYNGHEIIIERPDGHRLTALAHANPIHNESGTLVGAVNVLVDISDRKQAENSLREADRSKDEFLATLAHELRNPLAPVRNALRILQLQGLPTPESKWAHEVIDRQMQQMTRLIDDLMDVSRITRNKLELRRERVELAQVIRSTLETTRLLFESGGQTFTAALPPQPIYLDADLTRLAQAFSNLLNNAAKYTEPGDQVCLTAEQQGDEVAVTVKDTGIGIPTDMLPRIFEIFTQVDRSLEKTQGGLGIGLALVRRLVEMHGGSIQASSEGLGKGSEFVVRLPVISVPTFPAPWKVDNEPQRASCAPCRIVVADDNEDCATSMGMMLKIMGNEVHVAYDGVQAIKAAEVFRPHVLILDIGMPNLNGYDTARHIREQPWSKDITLVALTGWGQDEDKRRSREAGFDHHLVKPVNLTALEQLVTTVVTSVQKTSEDRLT